jgi:uncharacterized membrane protein
MSKHATRSTATVFTAITLTAAAGALGACRDPVRAPDAGVESSALGARLGGRNASGGYSVTDLGTLGGPSSEASAINDDGEIVGAAAGRAFFRTAGGTMVDIGPGGAEDVSNRDDVNNSRLVAGTRSGSVVLRTVDASGAVTSEINLGPGVARGVNKFGLVAGAAPTASGTWRATVWSSAGQRTDLVSFGGGYTEATDISDDGVVVGFSNDASNQDSYAVRWRPKPTEEGGGWHRAEPLSAETRAAAHGVNAGGDAVGGYWADEVTLRAFLWLEGGGSTELATLGGTRRFAYDVNVRRDAVGWSYDRRGTKKRAVVWPAGGGVVALGMSGKARGAEARGINAGGKIVGFIELPDGTRRAILWSPE